MLRFEEMYSDSQLPIRGTEFSAGYDLYAHEAGVIMPHEKKLIKTGITAEMGCDNYLSIVPRSGLALKKGITVLNAPGTVDADYYPNEIGVILYNTSDYIYEVNIGDRIAQGIVCRYELAVNDNVKDAKREFGFGSTGVNDNTKSEQK